MMQKHIWIDSDLSVGMKRENRSGYSDVDDGYAILQLFKAENVTIHGISAVFGNTSIQNAFLLCEKMTKEFSNQKIPVYKGADIKIDLGQVETNEAVEALAEALKKQILTILAIGPASNVGLLLLKYPELKSQIQEVVLVAGRRKPTDNFPIGNKGRNAGDANFDMDVDSFRLLFQSEVPVTLCPFEISSKVWIKHADLEEQSRGGAGNQWLAENSQNWLNQWKEQGADGFNPFDVLASHYIINPNDIISENLNARIEIHANDTVSDECNFKPYLLCDKNKGYPIKYCYDVTEGYHEKLMKSLND